MQELTHAVILSTIMLCKTEHGLCIILSTKEATVSKATPLFSGAYNSVGGERDSDGVKQQRNECEIFPKVFDNNSKS